MTLWLLIVPTVCYMLSALIMFLDGDKAGALTFGAYGTANIGLIWRFLYT